MRFNMKEFYGVDNFKVKLSVPFIIFFNRIFINPLILFPNSILRQVLLDRQPPIVVGATETGGNQHNPARHLRSPHSRLYVNRPLLSRSVPAPPAERNLILIVTAVIAVNRVRRSGDRRHQSEAEDLGVVKPAVMMTIQIPTDPTTEAITALAKLIDRLLPFWKMNLPTFPCTTKSKLALSSSNSRRGKKRRRKAYSSSSKINSAHSVRLVLPLVFPLNVTRMVKRSMLGIPQTRLTRKVLFVLTDRDPWQPHLFCLQILVNYRHPLRLRLQKIRNQPSSTIRLVPTNLKISFSIIHLNQNINLLNPPANHLACILHRGLNRNRLSVHRILKVSQK